MKFSSKIEDNQVLAIELEEKCRLKSANIWNLRIEGEIFANIMGWKVVATQMRKNMLKINLK
jgi:hypothetical protein